MIYPEFLKEHDVIGVTAPSAGSENELDIKRLNLATRNLNNLGYGVKETSNCRTDINGRSSSETDRAKQVEELFLDPNVKAIIGLSGGDFLVEMLSYVNLDNIKKHPKWFQGYSDITGLSYTITTNLDIATLYGNNFKIFAMEEWHRSIKENLEILKGNMIIQNSYDKYEEERVEKIVGNEGYNLDSTVEWKNLKDEKSIELKGRMLGGCLDVILCLIGTKFDNTRNFINKYKDDGIIWFFDNYGLTSEGIIRSMWQLKEAGYFRYTKGIIFGRSATEESCYDIAFKDAVETSLKDINVPIIINADIGHKLPQMTIINGAIAKIKSEKGKGSIEFELK